MKSTKLVTDRGATRPAELRGPFGTMQFTDLNQMGRTRVVAPSGAVGLLRFGPTTPGPFGEVVGLIEESKVVFRYRPWGSVEPGRHSFEIRHEGAEYVLVSRGRGPKPQLETVDGRLLAVFGERRGRVAPGLTEEEAVLVALITASGIADVTLPQGWLARH
ncbi:MAG: hypothetical protein ACR2OI_04305 [Acidimicrobiia bacterium]